MQTHSITAAWLSIGAGPLEVQNTGAADIWLYVGAAAPAADAPGVILGHRAFYRLDGGETLWARAAGGAAQEGRLSADAFASAGGGGVSGPVEATGAGGAALMLDATGQGIAARLPGALSAGGVLVTPTSAPLPAGAATEAKQDAGNASLASLDAKAAALEGGRAPVALGAAVAVSGQSVTAAGSIAAGAWAVIFLNMSAAAAATVAGAPLPAGASVTFGGHGRLLGAIAYAPAAGESMTIWTEA